MKDAEKLSFRLLGPGATVDRDHLGRLYAYPDGITGCLVRANVIAGLDGGATRGGASGGLGGPGDRLLFGILRELADVIVVGAGTARSENYGGAKMTDDDRHRRRSRGQAEVPPIALITRAGGIAADARVLTDTEVAPLILTCTQAACGVRRRLGSTAEVIDCSSADPGEVDLTVVLNPLAERGLGRVLTEGGPTLLGAIVAEDLLDELCLTVAPVLTAGDAVRVAAGPREVFTRMRPAHAITDAEDFLYNRYVRAR